MISLTQGARFLTDLARDTVRAFRHQVTGRQVWQRGGRAHVEARAVHHIDVPPEYLRALEEAVTAIRGVNWAAINGVLGDVVADFDPELADVSDIIGAIEQVETDYGMADQPRDRLRHPSDFEPVFDELVEIGGDVLGAAASLAGRVVPFGVAPEVAGLLASLDLIPRIRQGLESRFGRTRVELGFSLTGAVLAAAAHTPLSLLADASLRVVELPAVLARRAVWEKRGLELAGEQYQACADAQASTGTRPVPLPKGAVERYADTARTVAEVAAAVLLPIGGLRKAARVIAVGAPRAARTSIDAYAAEVSSMLSRRDAVVRDPHPLRRLDRIDTVVLDAAVLRNGTDGELSSLTQALVSAAHDVGKVVITPIRSHLVDRTGADSAIAGGSHLAASVRQLQAEGHVVLVVTSRNDPGLAAADLGVGVMHPDSRPPWAAHILCGPDLADVWLILQACARAPSVARRGVRLALIGSIGGAALGFLGRPADAGRRGAMPVSLAAIAGIVASVFTVRRLSARRLPQAADDRPWHAMPVEQVLTTLHTDSAGLTESASAARRAESEDDGPSEETFLGATVSELDNPLTAPLAAGAGVSALTGATVDAGLVGAVMIGNSLLGAVQRMAAARAMRRLASVGAVRARVRRPGGQEEEVDASQLVSGDVIVLYAGDSVPADCRVIEAEHLEVDESSLTGESMPVTKGVPPTDAAEVAERTSMLYAGTTVAAGHAIAVVVATGSGTESGRSIADSGDRAPSSGVEARLSEITKASLPIAIGAAATTLGLGLLRGQAQQSLSSAVALAVAAVPEGLPFVATAAQLSAARRLSRRQVLVRAPRTLEALGRVTTVCFDKTGTLTEGRIDVRTVVASGVEEPVDALTGQRRLTLAGALRASPADGDGREVPHPTDRAVLSGGRAAAIAPADYEPGWHRVRELPFEAGRGYHAVLGRTDGRQVISVKGAPEIVLPRCAARRQGDDAIPLTDADRDAITSEVEALALRGYRVLAVAERGASDRNELDSSRIERLDFVGLLCLADPVRQTAANAVRTLQRAGVKVIMLTGDHPSTSEAIAAELGLPTHKVVTGTQVEQLSEEELVELARDAAVFARVSPSHKVAIVRALQGAGQAVAVTGDGTNDAPAIRLADVGIALGPNSMPAAKQAADIVIADERIETIVDAVIESRALWRSVRDSVGLLIGGNLGEIGFSVGSSVLSARSALNARQLLAVNLLTDLMPALAVSVRPPRGLSPEDLLLEGPDAAVGRTLTRDIASRAIATGVSATAGWLAARFTSAVGGAGTVGFTTLVGAQLAQTAASSHGDPVILATAAASAVLTVLIVQLPFTSVFFGCRPLMPQEWAITALASAAAVPIAVFARRILDGRHASSAAPADAGQLPEPVVPAIE